MVSLSRRVFARPARAPSSGRRALLGLTLVVTLLGATAPQPAFAIHGRCGGGWHGGWSGWGGSCAPVVWGCGRPVGGFGIGCGVPCWPVFGTVSCGTGFAVGGTRFWSGTTVLGVPAWGVGVGGWRGWGWNGCGWGGGWRGGWIGGCGAWPGWGWGAPAWYGGWNPGPAWGWNPGPAWGWNPGPAVGWGMPFAGVAPAARVGGGIRPTIGPGPATALAATGRPRTVRGTMPARASVDPAAAGRLGGPAIDAEVEVAIRASNAPSRARAARLVALGDRHLRAAVDDPSRLAKAIDAYRRAAAIAADQPDTFLRQAIALKAAGKEEASAAAIARAGAIDRRLLEGGRAKASADPVFDGPSADAPPPLLARSGTLLGKIFATDADAGRGGNWIARRWFGGDAEPMMVAARP